MHCDSRNRRGNDDTGFSQRPMDSLFRADDEFPVIPQVQRASVLEPHRAGVHPFGQGCVCSGLRYVGKPGDRQGRRTTQGL